MKTLNNIVATLLALAMVVALGAGAYYAVMYVIDLFKGLDVQVTNIIYGAIVVVLFSMMLISMIGRRVQARAKRNQLFMQKIEVYKRFVKAWSSMLSQQAVGETYDEHSHLNEMQSAENELMLLASDDVIKKYIEFRNHSDGKTEDNLNPLDQLILTMRKDLGQSNIGFKKGDLADMLLNDTQSTEQTSVPSLNADGRVGLSM